MADIEPTLPAEKVRCRWCQRPIVIVYGMYGSIWAHSDTRWIECESGRTAEPEAAS